MSDTPDLPADDARERLLQATERLVYAGGIHATGMDLIVKTSGVARKRVYQYYPNKDALVAAALRARDERWMRWFIDATSRAATPRARLLDHIRARVRDADLPEPDEAAAQLLVLVDGAIAVALVSRDPAIADSARRAAATLLGPGD